MQEIYNVELLFKMPNTKTMRSRAAKAKKYHTSNTFDMRPVFFIYINRQGKTETVRNYGTESFYGKEDIPRERTLL